MIFAVWILDKFFHLFILSVISLSSETLNCSTVIQFFK